MGGSVTPTATLGSLIRSGAAAVVRYTGTLLTVFLAQSILAIATMIAIAVVLAHVFSHLPLWDDAVDGDLVALIACLRFASANVLACSGIALAAILLWQFASWFLIGGIYGVLAYRPEGRTETARCFGACGASTYLAFIRVTLCSLPNWFAVALLFAVSFNAAGVRFENALTLSDLIVPLAISIAPTAGLAHLLSTVADYTRADLILRPDHQHNVLTSYARSFLFVLKSPLTLLHSGLGWLGFAVITAGYGYLASGHPMFGTGGAIALFVIRQGVALARMAIRFGVLAGQLELLRARSPRRADSQPANGARGQAR